MKKIKYLMSIVLLGTLVSCGNKESKSVTLTVDPQLGQLGNFMSISDNEVTIKLIDENEEGEDVNSCVSSMSINVNKNVTSNYSFSFSLVVEDEDHIEISGLPDFYLESIRDWDNQSFQNVLQKGNYRAKMHESQTLEEWKDDDGQEIWNQICKRGKYVVVKPSWRSAKYVPYDESQISDSSSENIYEITSDEVETYVIDEDEIEEITMEDSNNTNESSQNLKGECEKALEQYKKLTKEAIALAKKVKEGDDDAKIELIQKSGECTTLSTKILDLANKSNDPSLIIQFQKINSDYLKDLQKYK